MPFCAPDAAGTPWFGERDLSAQESGRNISSQLSLRSVGLNIGRTAKGAPTDSFQMDRNQDGRDEEDGEQQGSDRWRE